MIWLYHSTRPERVGYLDGVLEFVQEALTTAPSFFCPICFLPCHQNFYWMISEGFDILTCEWHKLDESDRNGHVFCHLHEVENFCVIQIPDNHHVDFD